MSLILIIEDEFELRAGLAAGLRRATFDVAEAEDGDEGYAAIIELRPDLVLCDISMPGMRGDVLLKRLRREHPELARMPFLFLTALADHDSVLSGHELGADDYLTKPIDLDLLVAAVTQRLEQVSRWDASISSEIEIERANFLVSLSEKTRLSFLSAADVLNHLSDGVLLFNGGGRIIFINRTARRILSEEDGLYLRDGMLGGDKRSDSLRIRDFLAAILAPSAAGEGFFVEPLSLERPSGRRSYALRACKLEAGLDLEPDCAALAAIFLSDPETRPRPSAALLVALYDFTPTEARIVADLAGGLSVGEIAETWHISRNTIHHHLKSIFRKTDTKRQSELVSLVLSGLAVQKTARPKALPLPD
jgi:DNA-binding NarL/FixJ family response regulator